VGFLVSAAAVSTSFLGGLALTDGNGDAGSWPAIALCVAFGIASLRVLWPRPEGAEGFSARPSLIIREYLEPTDGTTASDPWVLYRELSLFSERKHEYNRRHHHQPLSAYFRAAVLLLTAEIAAWIVDLALR